MNVPNNLRYTKDHEWARVEGNTAVIGITDHAQSELGDIVFVELPKIGKATQQFQPCANIEAVKAVSDLFAPLSGEVIEVNANLEADPQIINKDPYGDGWILKIKMSKPDEVKNLLAPADYEKLLS